MKNSTKSFAFVVALGLMLGCQSTPEVTEPAEHHVAGVIPEQGFPERRPVLEGQVAQDQEGADPLTIEIRSELPRILNPEVSSEAISTITNGNTEFATALYRQLTTGEDNVFFSPHSISLALVMTYAGARGDTAAQMADTLHFGLEGDDLHSAFNALDQLLASRSESEDLEGLELNLVNALWAQSELAFLPEYLDILAKDYGSGANRLDFLADPGGAREVINRWVSDQTNERIEELLPPTAITPLTRVVLTNAVYFNAAWRTPFDEDATADEPFYGLAGETVVPMMHRRQHYRYGQADGITAVEVPYNGVDMSMFLFMPDEGELADFEQELSTETILSIIDEMGMRQISLGLPQFEMTTSASLAEVLPAMGMELAFTPGAADFSGMTGNPEFHISDVVHQAFVSVDERGTEAAGATAVIMMRMSNGGETPTVTFDRPFVFLVRDNETGAVLFMGRFVGPQ